MSRLSLVSQQLPYVIDRPVQVEAVLEG